MPASLEEQFQKAVKLVQSLPKDGPAQDNATKLSYYAYYKQATVGKVDTSQPWAWDVVNRAKWDAWNGLGDMSKEAAMQAYVNQLSKNVAEPAPGSSAEFLKAYQEFMQAIGK